MASAALVQTDEAEQFFATAGTNVGRIVLLGNKDKIDGPPITAITAANDALSDGITKIRALANDPTRNDVLRHDAGRQVAERTISVLENSKAAIEAHANAMFAEADATIQKAFAADPSRATIQSEIRGWIREQVKTPEGLSSVREAMDNHSEVAAIIYHSPHFLLGLAQDVRERMIANGVERHLPKAAEMLTKATDLNAVAAKYPRVIRNIRTTFYNAAIAAQARDRVNI